MKKILKVKISLGVLESPTTGNLKNKIYKRRFVWI